MYGGETYVLREKKWTIRIRLIILLSVDSASCHVTQRRAVICTAMLEQSATVCDAPSRTVAKVIFKKIYYRMHASNLLFIS